VVCCGARAVKHACHRLSQQLVVGRIQQRCSRISPRSGPGGFVEGEGIRFEYLYADGAYQRLPGMAAELVRPNVAVIAAGAPPAALAAKAATIPIVFVVGFDPVTAGLVASYNRPGGNATGVCLITSPLSQERLELIFELVPKARIISMLVNPHVSGSAIEVEDAASTLVPLRKSSSVQSVI
jgi:putative ABC transport system substrate-binding protein